MTEKTSRQMLVDSLAKSPPDYDRAREIIAMGEDINASDEKHENAFCSVLFEYIGNCFDCKNFGVCKKCNKNIQEHLPQIAEFFVEQGLDTVKHGIRCIECLSVAGVEKEILHTIQVLLKNPLPEEAYKYQKVLKRLLVQEKRFSNFQGEKNVIHAMYEAVRAKSEGRDFRNIDTYHSAIGLTLDKLVYFSFKDDIKREEKDNSGIGDRGFVYSGDIGFVCGDKVLVVRNPLKILMMNNRLNEAVQRDISYWLNKNDVYTYEAIGAKIKEISFDNNEIKWLNGHITRHPIIKIKFDNNVFVEFTCDMDEHPERETRPRFKIMREVGADAIRRFRLSALFLDLKRNMELSEPTCRLIYRIVKSHTEENSRKEHCFTQLRLIEILVDSENEDILLRKLAAEYPEAFE